MGTGKCESQPAERNSFENGVCCVVLNSAGTVNKIRMEPCSFRFDNVGLGVLAQENVKSVM